jgi:hypothetical protein
MLRRQQANLPGRQRAEEFYMAVKERAKVHGGTTIYEIQEQVCPTVRSDADRQLVGEVPEGLLGRDAESKVRQLIWPERR